MRSATISDHSFIIASRSVNGWWRDLAGARRGSAGILIDENSDENWDSVCTGLVRQLPKDGTTVFLSSHDSLRRDAYLSERLEEKGYLRPFGASRCAAELGSDKVRMKEMFERIGTPTPAWWRSGRRTPAAGLFVSKPRYGTMGQGAKLVDADQAITGDIYLEEYVPGVEFSVILIRRAGTTLVFPPVWKGSTNQSLVPPHRRARICSTLHSVGATQSAMIQISVELAEALEFEGFLEAEFVISPSGSPLVLEINPRIAATMRMAALSARAPLFDLPTSGSGIVRLSPAMVSLELPLNAPVPRRLEHPGVVATSRVTIVAETIGMLVKRLEWVLEAGAQIPAEAVGIARSEISRLMDYAEVSGNALRGSLIQMVCQGGLLE